MYTIQTTWGAREKMVEKRFRDIDALVSKIKILLPNSVRCRQAARKQVACSPCPNSYAWYARWLK